MREIKEACEVLTLHSYGAHSFLSFVSMDMGSFELVWQLFGWFVGHLDTIDSYYSIHALDQ